MKRIGFIDLDTTHARSFAARLNKIPGIQVTHVFDRARVRGGGETRNFCRDFNVMPCQSAEELASCVDGAMILSADWETHFKDLEVMIKNGVPTFCDKPLAGSLRECQALVELDKTCRTPTLCGSGWRWNSKVQSVSREFRDKEILALFVAIPNDLFYYGIHAIECVLGILGPGILWIKTECHGDKDGTLITLGHRRGVSARVILRSPFFYREVSFSAEGIPRTLSISPEDIHDGICGSFADMVLTGKAVATMAEYTESVKVMLAIEQSIRTGETVAVNKPLGVQEIKEAGFMESYIASYQASLQREDR